MSEARNLLKDALDAMKLAGWVTHDEKQALDVIDSIETYLAKPELEPVLYVDKRKFELSQSNDLDGTHLNNGLLTFMTKNRVHDDDVPLYAEPPARKPLSNEQLDVMRQRHGGELNFVTLREFKIIAKAIEKAHGIGE